MIKSDKGNLMIEGYRLDIEADFCVVIHHLWEQKFFTKEDLYEIIELSCQSKEELHKQVTEQAKELYPLMDLCKQLVFGEEKKETHVAEMMNIVEEIKRAKGENK